MDAKCIRKKTESIAGFDLKRKNQVLSDNWKDIELIQDPLYDPKQIISPEMKMITMLVCKENPEIFINKKWVRS